MYIARREQKMLTFVKLPQFSMKVISSIDRTVAGVAQTTSMSIAPKETTAKTYDAS